MKHVLVFLLSAAACAGQSQPSSYTIAGQVTDSVSGRPLGRVRVVLAPAERPTSELSSRITAEDGHFHFEVSKGKYNLRAERNGLAGQPYGAESIFSGFGVAIIAGPGQNTANLVFAVHPPSSLSGIVLDEAGEPVEDAIVQLMYVRVIAGRRSAFTLGWSRTNDLGEYRFGGLASGEYYLAVTGKPWYVSDPRSVSDGPAPGKEIMRGAFVPAFYPNTADPRAAAPIEVKPGQEAVASFALFTKPGFTLTIQCESCTRKAMRLDLISEGVLGTQSFHRTEYIYARSVMPAVSPGMYTVRISNQDTGNPIVATATADLTSADAEVALTPREAARVSGQVTLENADPRLLSRMFITLRSEDFRTPSFSREIAPDGTFQVPVSWPGKFRLWITGVPGVFASRVTSEDSAFHNGVLTIGDTTSVKLNVVASGGMGRVKGFVRRNDVPASGVLVVLASAALPADPGLYLGFKTDSDGSFDFKNVRPGAYRLFTVSNTELEYANPEAIRPYLEAAKPLTIEMNGAVDVDLELP
jgi:hypothetical protein